MKRLVTALLMMMGIVDVACAAEMPDSCRNYIGTVEQLVAASNDERRNQALLESVATIRETLQMLNDSRAELATAAKNVPHTDPMLDSMSRKVLKRLSHTCDVMYRQIPPDLIEDLRTQ